MAILAAGLETCVTPGRRHSSFWRGSLTDALVASLDDRLALDYVGSLFDLAPDRSNKTDKFARNGVSDDSLLFAVREYATIAGAQSE